MTAPYWDGLYKRLWGRPHTRTASADADLVSAVNIYDARVSISRSVFGVGLLVLWASTSLAPVLAHEATALQAATLLLTVAGLLFTYHLLNKFMRRSPVPGSATNFCIGKRVK